ncbi:MAG: phosphoribosylformylglycinamidine synthase, partial [Chlorobi bacterium]|nr:phosphoribosylformylglycinamidine synthase [Chlorobiota bacterium]
EPVLVKDEDTKIVYIDLSKTELSLGGSSFAQIVNKLGDNAPTVKDTDYFKKGFEAVQELIKKGLVLAGHDVSAGGLVTTLLEMNFPNTNFGMDIDLSGVAEKDLVKLLFSENPGVVLQVKDIEAVSEVLKAAGVDFNVIGSPVEGRTLTIAKDEQKLTLNLDELRDVWFRTSYLLDRKQSGEVKAKERFENYKNIKLEYNFPESFTGKLAQFGLKPDRTERTGVKAAIIREKGVNGDREMAYSMYLAGFDVKDVHMTDLIAGRETLEDVNFIVFTGGFSNSDVLGSAKGWAGAFLYNEKAKKALDDFYARPDTLSLGICNGCQLMNELELIYPDHDKHPKLLHNDSHKFESGFLNVEIPENDSVMFKSLAGSRLGVWVAHGEGKFDMPLSEDNYHIPAKYSYSEYPGNPNGSAYNTAAVCSKDGRHLAMMPHLERAIFPWQWANYPADRKADEITPWVEAFVNARKWIEKLVKG